MLAKYFCSATEKGNKTQEEAESLSWVRPPGRNSLLSHRLLYLKSLYAQFPIALGCSGHRKGYRI